MIFCSHFTHRLAIKRQQKQKLKPKNNQFKFHGTQKFPKSDEDEQNFMGLGNKLYFLFVFFFHFCDKNHYPPLQTGTTTATIFSIAAKNKTFPTKNLRNLWNKIESNGKGGAGNLVLRFVGCFIVTKRTHAHTCTIKCVHVCVSLPGHSDSDDAKRQRYGFVFSF